MACDTVFTVATFVTVGLVVWWRLKLRNSSAFIAAIRLAARRLVSSDNAEAGGCAAAECSWCLGDGGGV